LPVRSGFDAIPQQTPRAVIDGPEPTVALPPLKAVLAVTEVAAAVVTVGTSGTGSGSFFSQLKEMKAKSSKARICFMYYGLITNVGNYCRKEFRTPVSPTFVKIKRFVGETNLFGKNYLCKDYFTKTLKANPPSVAFANGTETPFFQSLGS
jgi:hypothetical protein